MPDRASSVPSRRHFSCAPSFARLAAAKFLILPLALASANREAAFVVAPPPPPPSFTSKAHCRDAGAYWSSRTTPRHPLRRRRGDAVVFVHGGYGNEGRATAPTTATNVDDSLREILWRMTSYFSSMVDPSTNRFYSLSRPPSGELVHQHCPIRDLGVAWDATTVLSFWSDRRHEEWLTTHQHQHSFSGHRRQLSDAVRSTVQAYNASYAQIAAADGDGGLALDSDILREPPNVAHSAFVLLASTGALRLSLLGRDERPPLDALTRGILSMQRQDGAFRIEFGSDDVYQGIEFFAGEAMVGLMEVYHLSASMPFILSDSTRKAILPAMETAFPFYADFYHQGDVDTNYNIWQAQAFARLFHALHDDDSEGSRSQDATLSVASHVLDLCQNIVQSRSWKELARGPSFYPNLETVEIACGLDAIVEGIRVAFVASRYAEAMALWTHAENAVRFLKTAQDRVPPDAAAGSGGLGYGGIQVLEQRLDVTGHAVSALTKVLHVHDEWISCAASVY